MNGNKKAISCTKVKYRTKQDAQLALVLAQTRNRRDPRHKRYTDRHEVRYYFCGICKAWHLTSSPQRMK